jgi:hypothetical protein
MQVVTKTWLACYSSFNSDLKKFIESNYFGIFTNLDLPYYTDLPTSQKTGFNIIKDSYVRRSSENLCEYDIAHTWGCEFEYWQVSLNFVDSNNSKHPSIDELLKTIDCVCWYYARNKSFAFKRLEVLVDHNHPWFDVLFPDNECHFGVVVFQDFFIANIPGLAPQSVIHKVVAKKLGMV